MCWQDNTEFDAHDVGKWVLDCYAQDHKLKSNVIQSEAITTNESASVNPVRLTKQSAVEYEASFSLPLEPEASPRVDQTKVVPLTKKALQNHNVNLPRYSSQSSKSSTEVTGDNIDLTRQTSDHGVFQQELVITKNKIKRFPERERTPEPPWKSEKYKSNLHQWNPSPSGNVVLAELCSVNDTDDTSSTVSLPKSPTPEPVRVPTPQPQIQIPITQNTRFIRPQNQRPRYNEETIVPSSAVPASTAHQGEQKLHGSISSSSTDKEETRSLSKVPSEHSDVSSQGFGKNFPTDSNRSKPIEQYKANVHLQATAPTRQPFESRELVTANKAPAQRELRPTWARNPPRSYKQQPLREAPARSFEQQPQTEAPGWSKKPSITARNHNRQPYLEKIAKASEPNYRQQAYQSYKPRVGSFDSNASNSSQSNVTKLPANGNSTQHLNSGASLNQSQRADTKVDGAIRQTQPAVFPTQRELGIGLSKQQVTSDSDTESTSSSDSSEEMISPKRTLREAFKTRGPYVTQTDEQSHHTHSDLRSPMQNAPITNRNPTPGPRRSQSVSSQNSIPLGSDDWRMVGQNSKVTTPTQNVIQHNPTVPKPQLRGKMPSIEDNRHLNNAHKLVGGTSARRPSSNSNPQQSKVLPHHQQPNSLATGPTQPPLYTTPHSNAKSHPAPQFHHQDQHISQPTVRSVSNIEKASTSSDELDNPFNTMDEDEISSIVEKIPGRSVAMTRSGSESDIMEKLEKSRMVSKTETLEERTARILGIHRRMSNDDSSGETNSRKNTTSLAESGKDLNAYMNNLLTGVTTVSPTTKQKYLSSDNTKTQTTSSLVTNSVSATDYEKATTPQPTIEVETSKHRSPAKVSFLIDM